MDLIQKQQHINNLKNAQKQYSMYASYYNEVSDLFDVLVKKLENGLETDYQTLRDKSEVLTNKLRNQDLNQRLNFIDLNKFNEFDLQLLSGLLTNEIQNSVPVLELFPGSGQFLPYAVAGEPLYIADRFIDVCNQAAKSLNNEFYSMRRLRKYEINGEDFSALPNQSFGIVYCFNEFFMSNEEYILQIAKQVYDLLYDGGKFIFNFMPDDQVWSQQLSLTNNFTIVNYKNLIEKLTIMGYTITNYDVRQLKSSYIIVSKGTTSTPRLKVGGGYAEIIDN
jgi:hypothetical protein